MTSAATVIVSELHAIVAGLLGGARYGFKIRLPHALVMTMLFRRDLSSRDKLRNISKLALEHASNLAAFAALYKTILAALKWTSRHIHHNGTQQHNKEGMLRYIGRVIISLLVDGPYPRGQRLVSRAPGHPEKSYHALVAGAVGGYFVWGRYSSVNYQIVLYLASRVLAGILKHIKERCRLHGFTFEQSYPVFAATVWGLVMMLFEESPDVLHPSLKQSMDEIYRYNLVSENDNRNNGSSEQEASSSLVANSGTIPNLSDSTTTPLQPQDGHS